jgi:succinyl-diaminopimelate desuccinylase
MHENELWRIVRDHRAELLAFAQKLLRTPSRSGEEGNVAALIRDEMGRLGYGEAWIDEAGNAVGRLTGGPATPLMFNGHMDHVDAGDPQHWPHPPFGGEVHGGELWGRGAADMKGAVAAMVYAVGLVKELGRTLPGDLYVSAVVQEEVGGLGARHLADVLPPMRVVIGEASGNQLRRGHRGRVEMQARFEGRSVHASMPDLGVNPHFSAARFVQGLRELPMRSAPDYGASSVAPTLVRSEPQGTNITPATIRVALDWRNVPGEELAGVLEKLEGLLARSLEPGCNAVIEVGSRELTTYTGYRMRYDDSFASFTTPPDHPWLLAAHEALAAALEREVEVGVWRFATDGGHLAAAGSTVLGLGPGDDTLVHTVEERLPVDQLLEATVAYMALALLDQPAG